MCLDLEGFKFLTFWGSFSSEILAVKRLMRGCGFSDVSHMLLLGIFSWIQCVCWIGFAVRVVEVAWYVLGVEFLYNDVWYF